MMRVIKYLLSKLRNAAISIFPNSVLRIGNSQNIGILVNKRGHYHVDDTLLINNIKISTPRSTF
jgi:hypothetical protein